MSDAPLAGRLVVDLSRMLPGAVLARQLLELGARLIKVEPPAGDPLRGAPPLVDGVGAGFRTFLAGAESIALDLRDPADAARARKLAKHADVVVESFRPGVLEEAGLGPGRLLAANPALVVCRLSAFGGSGAGGARVGHDLNLVAESGLLSLLPPPAEPGAIPRAQLADVSAALLACSAVLGALLARARDGRGRVVDQPLARGPLPFVAWAAADAAVDGEAGGSLNAPSGLLAGGAPCYRIYACAGGTHAAVGALEPKFWTGLLEMLGLDGEDRLAGAGLDTGAVGREAAARVAGRLAEKPAAAWVAAAVERGLPISEVLQPRTQVAAAPWLRADPADRAAPALDVDGPALHGEFALGSTNRRFR